MDFSKVVLKLFKNYLRTVFSLNKNVLLGVFSACKVYKWPQKSTFVSKFDPLLTYSGVIFGHFRGRKSCILDFFKVVWELFRKCLGIVLGLKRPTFDEFIAISDTRCYPYRSLSFGVPRSPKKYRPGFPWASSLCHLCGSKF